jgi:hypothetical protein
MKNILICSILVGATFISCTEKTDVALTVFRDKQENKMLKAVGEGEAAIELLKRQYGVLKENLVRLKTIELHLSQEADHAIANNNLAKAHIIESKLSDLRGRIPKAENELQDFYFLYEHKKDEIRNLKDELNINIALAKTTPDLPSISNYEKRMESINDLVSSLREKVKRSEAILNVSTLESNFKNNEIK